MALFHRIYCQRYLKRKLFFMLKYLNKCSYEINVYRQRRIRNIPAPNIICSGDRVIPGRNTINRIFKSTLPTFSNNKTTYLLNTDDSRYNDNFVITIFFRVTEDIVISRTHCTRACIGIGLRRIYLWNCD